MKKNLLLLCMLFVAITMNAQFTVEDGDGSPIVDGDIAVFDVAADFSESSLDFFVNNTSATDDINMKIEFVSALNADGTKMELCFGLCYTGIIIGQVYPPGSDVVTIAPGGQTLPGNHMYNFELGDGVNPVEYVFRFYQVDGGGNEIGTDLSMTYRYDPTLGVNDLNKLDVAVKSTVVTSELALTINEDVNLVIYDLQGRVVQQEKLSVGQQSINVSNLRSQMYLLHFSNDRGVSQTTKIVVR